MDLPVMPPVEPMLAKPVKEIPDVGHAKVTAPHDVRKILRTDF
ncbi:hypothetical protein GCM10027449_16530 [Sinomonas notoginsengisoli]|nr:hypothetical protein [Sinomonas notoginsengisoli]